MNYILLSIVVIVYLAVVAYLGYLGYSRTKNASDYLVAGRKAHPFVMALSYGATFISTSAIVGFGGAAGVFGMGLLWLTFLNIIVGIFIAFVFFGKRTRKMGHNLDAHTFPELIGKRYDSRFLQWASGLLIFVGMPLYAAAVMIGGAQFVAQTLHINYEAALLLFAAVVAVYVIMGGLKSVMYTDAFQGVIMFIGMAILLFYTYHQLGGVIEAHKSLTALAPEAIKIFGKGGHLGWTSMPQTGSVMWLQLVTTIVMGVGIGVLAQPQLAVRFMTVKSDREINRAVLIGGIFILFMTGVAFIVGALSNVAFFKSAAYKAVSIVAAAKNVDNIIPLYINTFMPHWFTAIFFVTLLAAAMSTLSSQFHTMGSAFGRDFLETGIGIKGGNALLRTRFAMIVGILVSVLLSLFMPKMIEKGSAIIALGTAIFFGLCASAFLPLFVGALYAKKLSKTAAITGFLVGTFATLFWILFIYSKISVPVGLCQALCGVPTLAGTSKLQFLDPIIVALPFSAIVTVLVSFFSKKPDAKYVAKCFEGIG
jgi:SSS family solute:Na+ symporter